MAFTVIEPAAGLTDRLRRRVARVGPPSVLARTGYEPLLSSAGFESIDVVDVTAEYRRTQQGWVDAYDRRRDQLLSLMSDEEFDTGQRNRRATIRAIDDGLLLRRMYHARRL